MRYFIGGLLLSIGVCMLVITIRGAYLLHKITKYMITRGLTEVSLDEFYNYLNLK